MSVHTIQSRHHVQAENIARDRHDHAHGERIWRMSGCSCVSMYVQPYMEYFDRTGVQQQTMDVGITLEPVALSHHRDVFIILGTRYFCFRRLDRIRVADVTRTL